MAFTSKKNDRTLDCRECGEEVKNVGEDATAVVCWKCVAKTLSKGGSCFEDDIEEEEK